jgi:hypothetical protein
MKSFLTRLRGSFTHERTDGREDPAPLYFLHIPKTAGTSMRQIMLDAFGERLCPVQLWDDFFRDREGISPSYDAYLGHFGMDLPTFVGKRMRIFTLLREPVARTISHYLQVRRATAHPLHARVSAQTLHEFVHDPATVPMITNLQARYLVPRDVSIRELANVFTPLWDSQYSLSVAWENASCYISASLLEARAMEALKSFEFVGTTETFEEDLVVVRKLFGFAHMQVPHMNTSSRDEVLHSLEPEVEERIRYLTTVDRALYNAVRQMREARRQ